MNIRMHFKINIFICLFVSLFNHVKMNDLSEDFLKINLTKIEHIPCGMSSWGTNCSVYEADDKRLFFVKENPSYEFQWIFNGEYEGLRAIRRTKTVYVPRPVDTGHFNGNFFIAMEYLNLNLMTFNESYELGSLLADLHLHNLKNGQELRFGFDFETYSGVVPQNNTWTRDWVTFFIENRMDFQMKKLHSDERASDEDKKTLADYWHQLRPLIKKFFINYSVIPSLLHGNLWTKDFAQANSRPVLYSPAVFYGHHEYDIASSTFLFTYPKQFYIAYFRKIPKADGFENRQILYHLYLHLNNYWNKGDKGRLTPVKETFRKLLDIIS